MSKVKSLSANVLKIIAAISMVIDHIGFMIFPKITIFRILGRIAFPVFAYFLAKGCYYTKNKLKHFLTLFIVAAVCQTVYYLAMKSLNMSILTTFCISEALIYLLFYLKKSIIENKTVISVILTFAFILSIILTYFLNEKVYIDYGFWGCMAPLIISIFSFGNLPVNEKLKKLDCFVTEMILLGVAICLLPLSNALGWINFFSLFAIVLLLFYNGERGKYNMKYFFYVFYPLHLCLIEGIIMLINL